MPLPRYQISMEPPKHTSGGLSPTSYPTREPVARLSESFHTIFTMRSWGSAARSTTRPPTARAATPHSGACAPHAHILQIRPSCTSNVRGPVGKRPAAYLTWLAGGIANFLAGDSKGRQQGPEQRAGVDYIRQPVHPNDPHDRKSVGRTRKSKTLGASRRCTNR
jgi:hypothetical protein